MHVKLEALLILILTFLHHGQSCFVQKKSNLLTHKGIMIKRDKTEDNF